MISKNALKFIIILALIGMAADALLTYNKITSSKLGCPVGGGCDIVTGSVYSEFFGLPVSLLGFGAFLIFSIAALLVLKGKLEEGLAFKFILVFAAFGMIIAIWFVYLMLFVLDAICPWCMVSHIVLTGIFIISLLKVIESVKK